jgi:hypothetical protein
LEAEPLKLEVACVLIQYVGPMSCLPLDIVVLCTGQSALLVGAKIMQSAQNCVEVPDSRANPLLIVGEITQCGILRTTASMWAIISGGGVDRETRDE